MASISFRARPGAIVRVIQTVAGPILRVENSGSSNLNHYISNSSAELDIQVDINTTEMILSVIPAPSELVSTEVSPQQQETFNSIASDWEHGHVWPSSVPDANPLSFYSEVNNSTCSGSLNHHHDDIFELNTLLSSLQRESTLESASLDPMGLDIPFNYHGHFKPSTTGSVNDMQGIYDYSDTGSSTDGSSKADSPDIGTPYMLEPVQGNHTSVAEALQNFTIVSQGRKSQFSCRSCDRVFTREYTRKVHEDAHATRAAGPLLCREPDCNTTFSRSHDRLR
ncbi:hypothetical protein K435DRAFT_871002 [Dendrothele bispora CBS 962.96]|uniref:C2H2-type domain-containing protein n=1 Tax=Dendrothele bispora (strain CBS 962.96) TaxID=1314807 RepID=A0A4S8L5K3_DENBC|nr:hypothetical protein K435DRAFT_871002 [Dendrothele bispora CBS 962.96]